MVTISQYATSLLNAGPKAKIDVEKILQEAYKSKVHTLKLTGKEANFNKFEEFIFKIRKAIFSTIFLHGDDLTIIQVPFLNDLRFTKKLKNKVAFIHDLEGIRKQDKRIEDREIKFINSCKYIVVHNNKMRQLLIDKNVPQDKIYVLELFDYLCQDNQVIQPQSFDEKNLKIIYTGNMDKAPFIKQLDPEKMKFKMNVYGMCNQKINNEKIDYKGKFLPDELPNHIEGDLGLVWDGNYDESDENQGFKGYTKYNNPHKLSCYIAAEKPVIVWKKAAIAEIVEKYNIGYTINNLYEINDLNLKNYNNVKQNVKDLSQKVKKGYFTKSVINEILEKDNMQ